jgi:hypothetical protein
MKACALDISSFIGRLAIVTATRATKDNTIKQIKLVFGVSVLAGWLEIGT